MKKRLLQTRPLPGETEEEFTARLLSMLHREAEGAPPANEPRPNEQP